MKRFLAFAVATLLSSVAVSQGAEAPPPPSDPAAAPAESAPTSPTSVFDSLDADRDGRVAQQEAQAHATVAEHFAKADANGDGALTKEEFDAAFRSQ